MWFRKNLLKAIHFKVQYFKQQYVYSINLMLKSKERQLYKEKLKFRSKFENPR